MSNFIKILPDTLANQIAAGEVIQRPASVVKELVENAIDAQANKIIINIKDAGRTLIQVIDNGSGMSPDDARLSFERHATSKISTTDDLFSIHTKGFRGEALASIAAIAYVELKTRRNSDTIGTQILIEGNKILSIESVNTPVGSNFSVKNIFFNVPARRKFLKSDITEFGQIITEIYRLAVPHNEIEFTLIHNESTVLKLNNESLKERLVNLFDKSLNKQLIKISSDAGFIKISGYVGKPEFASKSNPKQYFFVNNRFMKSGYFHKAVMMAFDKLINNDSKPNYFIFFDIEPSKIDINIHPTKTEINFDDANSVFQIIISSIRKALTEFDIPASIDFENTEFVNIESYNPNKEIKFPEVKVNQNYNPFDDNKDFDFHLKISQSKTISPPEDNILYKYENNENDAQKQFLVIKNKYIFTNVKSGAMIIDINRALNQIEYEIVREKISTQNTSQETLYPVQINFSAIELLEFENIKNLLENIGFRFEKINERSFNITATPTYVKFESVIETIHNIIRISTLTTFDIEEIQKDNIAVQITNNNKPLNPNFKQSDLQGLINKLFRCKSHQFDYNGDMIIYILDTEQIDNLFNFNK